MCRQENAPIFCGHMATTVNNSVVAIGTFCPQCSLSIYIYVNRKRENNSRKKIISFKHLFMNFRNAEIASQIDQFVHGNIWPARNYSSEFCFAKAKPTI